MLASCSSEYSTHTRGAAVRMTSAAVDFFMTRRVYPSPEHMQIKIGLITFLLHSHLLEIGKNMPLAYGPTRALGSRLSRVAHSPGSLATGKNIGAQERGP